MRPSFYSTGRTPSKVQGPRAHRAYAPEMFSALRLVLFDDGNILKSVALASWATWLIIGGALYGVLRAAWDVLKVLTLPWRLHRRRERRRRAVAAASAAPPQSPWMSGP